MAKQDDMDAVLDGDYRRRSTKTYLSLSAVLLLSTLGVYPKLRDYISSDNPDATVLRILPWFLLVLALIVVISVIPIILRRRSKRKEDEIALIKEQAELRSKYQTELEETTLTADTLEFFCKRPKDGEQSPTYRSHVNPNNDPYAPKVKGYAAQQASQGYPHSPALEPLPNPSNPVLGDSLISEEYREFTKVMQAKGYAGTELDLLASYQQLKSLVTKSDEDGPCVN